MSTDEKDETILVGRYRRSAPCAAPQTEHYKGCRIHAARGLHDFVADEIRQAFHEGACLADLGAGSGAMSKRLFDMGYQVTALDYVGEQFRPKEEVKFIQANLNSRFSELLAPQEGIIAVEIIEHLENPRRFFRECYKALKRGGLMIISTPNIDSSASKSLFVKYGTFKGFTDDGYDVSGHIMPISMWMLDKIVRETGFVRLWSKTHGDSFEGLGVFSRTRWFSALIRMVAKKEILLEGDILVGLLQKPVNK